jgi:hypothetical protein
MGYSDPLPVPDPGVVATLVALDALQVHGFVQTQDRVAMLDVDDEGRSAPLFLTMFDLSQWSMILSLSLSKDPLYALEKMRVAHSQLAAILDEEAKDLNAAMTFTKTVETALIKANPMEEWTSQPATSSSMDPTDSLPPTHPMLSRLNP